MVKRVMVDGIEHEIRVEELVHDHVVMRTPVYRLAGSKKYPCNALALREIMDAYPEKVKEAVSLRSNILKRGYEALAPKALKKLRLILEMNAVSEVEDKSGEKVKKVDSVLVRVQKEIAEGILEEIGAKREKKKSQMLVNNGSIVNSRKREIAGSAGVLARPVNDILAGCVLEKNEKVIELYPVGEERNVFKEKQG